MSKYQELWNHLKKVDGRRKLSPHTCFYERLEELMDHIEKLHDKQDRGQTITLEKEETMKIKLEIGGKTVVEIGWIHIIFFGIALFIGFCMFAVSILSL